MLETVAILLLVLWALGMVMVPTAGVAVHVLLVFVLLILVIRLLQGQRIL